MMKLNLLFMDCYSSTLIFLKPKRIENLMICLMPLNLIRLSFLWNQCKEPFILTSFWSTVTSPPSPFTPDWSKKRELLNINNLRNFKRESWSPPTSLVEVLISKKSISSLTTICLNHPILIFTEWTEQPDSEPKDWPLPLCQFQAKNKFWNKFRADLS